MTENDDKEHIKDIVPVYQIKGISKLVKLCLPKVQCFCDSLTSPPSERQIVLKINELMKLRDIFNPIECFHIVFRHPFVDPVRACDQLGIQAYAIDDVAIGAPKEDEFLGAVYIFHGDADGIVPQYSMRISGRKLNPTLKMFGQSISGGIDMDKNGYVDVTIGAFMSDSVVLLRTRPVITVDASIILPSAINITAPQCHDGTQNVNCVNVTVCFRFRGKRVPGEIGKYK
ncbi:unnamed protein product, partial [Ranitomeya imitator]